MTGRKGQGLGRLIAAEAAATAAFWSKVNILSDCWEWCGAVTDFGYGKLGHSGHNFTAHRCSYEYHYGRIPGELWVLHRCDNPPCVNPAHLFLGTPVDNTQDMIAKGRMGTRISSGEANPNARISVLQVIEIRSAFAGGATPAGLAEQFGLERSSINGIIRGRTWKNAGGPICMADRRGLHKKGKTHVVT